MTKLDEDLRSLVIYHELSLSYECEGMFYSEPLCTKHLFCPLASYFCIERMHSDVHVLIFCSAMLRENRFRGQVGYLQMSKAPGSVIKMNGIAGAGPQPEFYCL